MQVGWRGGATYRLVTSMFCIKKQFEHLSLIIAARICSLALFLSALLLLFHRATERLMHWMVKHFSRATLDAAKTQRHTKRTEDVCTGGTQDDLNICMEFFFLRPELTDELVPVLFSLSARTGGKGKSENFASLFYWRIFTPIAEFIAKIFSSFTMKTGLNQVRENPTKKRHRKHKKNSVSC